MPSGAYERLPGYWQGAASWLDRHSAEGHALMVPGGSLGEFVWGRPLDEPLQSLTSRTTWAVRDAVPLGSPGLTRLLDAMGARLDTGRGSDGLAPLLSRMGVRFLVVRNDLDRAFTTAPRPLLVHQALAASAGLRRVAAFGPRLGSGGPAHGLVVDRGLNPRFRAIEIYEPASPLPPVVTYPQPGTQLMSGGPESLLALADRGLLGPATVIAGDDAAGADARHVVTDGLRRREVAFGLGRENGSETLTAEAPVAVGQPVADFTVVAGERHDTEALLLGARRVTASSSASDASAFRLHRPDRQPWAAVDGDQETAWVSGSSSGAIGQWLEIDLGTPRDLTGTQLSVLDAPYLGPAVSAVEVITDAGRAMTHLHPGALLQAVVVPPGPSRRIRVRVADVAGRDGPGVLAGIRELSIPGVDISRSLVVPDDVPLGQTEGAPLYLFDRATGARPGCVLAGSGRACGSDLLRPGEETGPLDRTFTLNQPWALGLAGMARPVPGPALDALLDRGAPILVTASSRSTPDPAGRPGALADGDGSTTWTASGNDPHPSVTLSWSRARPLARMDLLSDSSGSASRPRRVAIVIGSLVMTEDVPSDGVLSFPPVVTDRVTVRFLTDDGLVSVDPVTKELERLPVGLAGIALAGVSRTRANDVPAVVTLACGSGPTISIDGDRFPTTVGGTRAALLTEEPLPLRLCTHAAFVVLPAGRHRLVGDSRGGFHVESVTLGSHAREAEPKGREVAVGSWGAQYRELQVAAGGATWLVVHENANKGWVARLNGVALRPARVDGWEQAWVLPSGRGGRVVLRYLPDTNYRLALGVGLAAALVLLVLASPWPLASRAPRYAAPRVGRDQGQPRRWRARFARRGLVGVVCVCLGGLWGLPALVVGAAIARRPGAAPIFAGSAVGLAGVLEAMSPWGGTRPPAALGAATQLLCLLAVATVAAAVSMEAAPSASSSEPVVPPRAD